MTLYNDNDPKCAAWLRELIAQGHLPAGTVSETPVQQLHDTDLALYNHIHLFAGIGGWALALQLAEWPLERPVWTGSCPCQPFSCAGQGRGERDERHLWPFMRSLIEQHHPPTIFGEQVASSAGREWLAGVRADLEALGYAAGAADLCAAGTGAPHIRQRLFWVAHRGTNGFEESQPASVANGPRGLRQPFEGSTAGGVALAKHADRWPLRLPRQDERDGCDAGRPQAHGLTGACGEVRDGGVWSSFALLPCRDHKTRRVEPGTFPLAHGVPARVGLLRGYGNAIVPQVAAIFIRAFLEAQPFPSATT